MLSKKTHRAEEPVIRESQTMQKGLRKGETTVW